MDNIDQQNENELPPLINISRTPPEIDLNDITIEQGKCFLNSYRLSKKYPDIEIIEGIILALTKKGTGIPAAHVWNKKGEIYFDITNEKVWTGKEEMIESKEINYFLVIVHNVKDFKNGETFEFCLETNENVEAMKKVIENNNSGKN